MGMRPSVGIFSTGKRGVLARLRQDKAGNVFAMTAAAVFPMIGVVGGAIDASRMYMVRSRLQAACDSAVLAGRKAMTTSSYSSTGTEGLRAKAMFDFNFQNKDYQTTGTAFNATADGNGKLNGTATTTIPMTMMKVFGYSQQVASVTCSADVQIPNIDIVFVLDVTGSMSDTIGGVEKIASLKASAKTFYEVLRDQMATNGTNAGRIRYGFVPYSQTVNGKDLFKASPDLTNNGELPMSALVNTATVESRVANFEASGGNGQWINDPNTGKYYLEQKYDHTDQDTIEPYKDDTNGGTYMSNNDCENYSDNKSFSIDNNTNRQVYLYPRTSWPGGAGIGNSTLYLADGAAAAQTSEPTSGNYYWEITFQRKSGTWEDNSGARTDLYKSCTRYVVYEKFIRNVPQFKFKNWTYRPVDYDVTGFKANGLVSYASAVSQNFTAPNAGPFTPVQLAAMADTTGLTLASFRWNGCIEERQTTAVNSFSPIPAAALDLDFLTGYTQSDDHKWRPIMHQLTYNRGTPSNVNSTTTITYPDHSCPTATMRNLQVWTETNFDNYVDALQPGGYTYLDIGMVWGLRFIAPQGMFASRNLVGPNGGQISRHIIFLTDGEPVSADNSVTSYGLETVSRRITGSTGSSAASLHAKRFQALCDAHRGTVAIWAIAFGTSVTGNLSDCADAGRAFQADDASDLNDAFTSIARDIADLRLVS